MKLTGKILIYCFLVATVLSSCERETEQVEPEPDPVVIKANAYASPDSISYAGATTLYWNTSNVASATVNNISIPTNGSKLFEGIKSDTTFTFKFISSDKKTETDTVITVKVAEPNIVSPEINIAHSMYWMFIKHTSLNKKTAEWETFYFDEDMRSRKWFLYSDNTYTKIKKNGVEVGNGSYEIKEGIKDTLILNKIEKWLISIELSSLDTLMLLNNFDSTQVNIYKGYSLK